MIRNWQIQRRGDDLILGFAVQNAVLDVVTDPQTIANCLALLESPHRGSVDIQMGRFGPFPVTLNLHHDDSVSIFIDGPDFDKSRCQSAAIWVGKTELQTILRTVLTGKDPK